MPEFAEIDHRTCHPPPFRGTVVTRVPSTHWNAFQLLNDYSQANGLPPLRVVRLRGDDLPQPCRALLVHSRDMTSTLEAYYGEETRLSVLRREHSPSGYSREVLLTTPRQGPVEYGLIRIDLEAFPDSIQRRILEAELPLGRLLLEYEIAHLCWPQGFFRVEPHAYVQSAMRLARPTPCYGRRNVIVDGQRRLLADVLEILTPCADAPGAQATPATPAEP